MLTHRLLLIRSSGSYHASPPNNAPLPGRLSRPFKAQGQATVAGVETAALTSTMEPRALDGPRPVIASFANKRSASRRGYLSYEAKNMMVPLIGSPICRCSVCASRRATRLAQDLQDKFGSLTPAGRIQ
jgi:hypothetical protein